MARLKKSLLGDDNYIEAIPKKTKQGNSKNTKYSSTSKNKAKKAYRGQGR